MMKPLRVLIVDDSEQDAALLLRELHKAGYLPVHRRVQTAEEMSRALDSEKWDLILCDYVMPGFSGQAALDLLHHKSVDLPFIIVSGQIGDDVAVEAMKAGANDYVFKGNLKRLGPAIQREIRDAQARQESRRAEAELRAKEEELRLAKKIDMMKDEFIGMVSHELKTPITVIIGALETVAMKGVTEEEAMELIKDAIDSASSLATIIDNLLELSRHRANRLSLRTESINIAPIAQNVAKGLQAKLARHRLVTDIPSGLPLVLADRVRVELILNNLIDNAIKYSPQGGEVKISVQNQDAHLVTAVSDQGVGIPLEDQPKLFQHFQRLEADTKHQIDGVGLGLRVCQILTEAHGGRIWLESTPGKGSTFFFTLPTAKSLRRNNSFRTCSNF